MGLGYKEYLGDAVYAQWTGYSIILTTEDGINVTNEIHLEFGELEALTRFIERAKEELRHDERQTQETPAAGHLHGSGDAEAGDVRNGSEEHSG